MDDTYPTEFLISLTQNRGQCVGFEQPHTPLQPGFVEPEIVHSTGSSSDVLTVNLRGRVSFDHEVPAIES